MEEVGSFNRKSRRSNKKINELRNPDTRPGPFCRTSELELAAWIMGGISEWMGAAAKSWYFKTVTFPPLFLILGCWPLEILVSSAAWPPECWDQKPFNNG
jgi:hypothetical protein